LSAGTMRLVFRTSTGADSGVKAGCVLTPADYPMMRDAGLDYAEISGRNVYAMDPGTFEDLKRMIRETGLPCRGFNAYCPPEVRIAGPGFSAFTAREYARRSLERAAELDVRVVGIGSPMSRNLPEGFDRGLAMRQAEEFFAVTAEVFSAKGILVCVEALGPCYCNFINRLAEAQTLVRNAGMENLKLVADFYNMEQSGEADVPLEPYARDIAHVHISDDAGSPRERWFLKPEKRELHISRLNRLLALGYRGGVTLEIDVPANIQDAAHSVSVLRDAFQTVA
jgi:sugar phosphate isomerase/epimerase